MKNQGDVHIWKLAALPKNANPRESRVVREGEVTGHAHRIVGEAVAVYDLDGRVMAVVSGDGVSLVHEEHGPITLEPGVHEFGPTYEYDYETEESRQVQD